MPDMSGVGISFGADRIYDVLTELNLFPENVSISTKVLFINFGEREMDYCLPIAKTLRDNGISTEIYPDSSKLKKQFSYADNKKIPFVIIAGEQEIENNTVKIKDMISGNEKLVSVSEIEKYFI